MSRQNTRAKLTEQVAQIKQATGADAIALIAPDPWVMRLGVIVDLDVCRWRGQAALTLEDLGLGLQPGTPAYEALKQTMVLGSKKFYPPEDASRLNSLESSARNALADLAVKTRYGYWVDVGIYGKLKQVLAQKRTEYLALGKEITTTRWDMLLDWIKAQYAENARASFERLDKMGASILLDAETRKKISRDDFVDAYVERVMQRIPTPAEVRKSFDFRIELSYIPMPSALAADLAEKERLQAKRALAQLAEQKRAQVMSERATTAAEKERAKRELLTSKTRERVTKRQAQHTQIELDLANKKLELEMRQKLLHEMNADVIASSNSDAQARAFTREVAAAAMTRVIANLQKAQTSFDGQGRLVGKSADGLRNTVSSYQALVVKSPVLDADIARLGVVLNRQAGERDKTEIGDLIDRILKSAKHALKALKV